MKMNLLLGEAEEPPSRQTATSQVSTKPHRLISPPSPTLPSLGAVVTRLERFPIGPATRAFRKRFYPEVEATEWNDWRWQARKRIRTLAELERLFVLSDDERDAVVRHQGSLPLGITPYYASLMSREDALEPLRRTHIPVGTEYLKTPGEADDPLGEDGHTAEPGLVHRYPDRVLFLATGFCSTYCRYCTRSRMVGEPGGEYSFSRPQWEEALDYIAAHPEIRDVLISGGDPLTLSDERLDYLIGRLRAIRHVEFVRLGTKVPVVLPMRVTRSLTRILKKHHPLWMSLHFTHPVELTPEVTEACTRLADAGIPLGSQTVLLKGINDSVDTLKTMYHGLLKRRVRPYYLYQCDPISGSSHFRTSVDKGLEIMQGLRGHTTGYAVPTYVVDAPGGGGKIPLLPDYVQGRDGDDLILKNFEGKTYRYTDPDGTVGADRTASSKKPLMRIALVYDLRDDYRALGFSEEEIAEFDNIDTIDKLEGALRALHCEVVRVGRGQVLAARLAAGERFDLVFSIAEGVKGRSREAQMPALCELFDQPYLLSDPLTSAVALDKAVAKRLVRDARVPTPAFMVASSDASELAGWSEFPAFVKPIAEGTGKGCESASVVNTSQELAAAAAKLLTRYHQPVLVETYLPGREFTVGIVGNGEDATVLGVCEILLKEDAEANIYSLHNKELCEELVIYQRADDDEARLAGTRALAAYHALQCRDAARIDFRSNASGEPYFLEANPLAGLHPHHSDLPILAAQNGISYVELVGMILDAGLARYGLTRPGTERARRRA